MQGGFNCLVVGTAILMANAAAALAADAPASPSFTGKAGVFTDEKITVGGEERIYRLEVPSSIDLSKPAPVVFAFHGMGEDNKDHYSTISGLPELAAEHKFILVFPAAAGQVVQGQAVKAWALAPERAVADIRFFDALLVKLQNEYRIDPDAVYVTGMSNGGYFAHLLTRERADIIAAVAVHSGELGQFDLPFIQTARKFPVMIIHGDADPVFSVDLARSARVLYEGAGHPVTYVEIPGWGHAWDPRVDEKIWDFFSTHRLHPTLPAQTIAAASAPIVEAPATEYPGYTLVWHDEFTQPGPPDPKNWTFESGFVRNEEQQWYQPQNAWCEGGHLIIEARREQVSNPKFNSASPDWKFNRHFAEYTSASLNTRGLHNWQYGRFEMRAKIDVSSGMWPAFWTLGVVGAWPRNGEVDIMEFYQGALLANVAWGSARPNSAVWNSSKKPLVAFNDPHWADKFHVWRMDWDENSIKLYVDDQLLNEQDLGKTVNEDPAHQNPFRQAHYLLVNLAIGGQQGGDPSASKFPTRYEIDYVRVYQKNPVPAVAAPASTPSAHP